MKIGLLRLVCAGALVLTGLQAQAWREENIIPSGDIVAARDRLRQMKADGKDYDYVTFESGTYDLSLIEDDPMVTSSSWMGKSLLTAPNGTIFRSKTGKPEDVILDATKLKDPARVFLIASGAEVQGVTIIGANAVKLKTNYSVGSAIGTTGGSTCYAKNCRFLNCKSENSGGAVKDIYCENCYFEGNSTTGWGDGGAVWGGQIKNCTFVGNWTTVDWCCGGAAASCTAVINCTSISNSASNGGAFSGCKGITNCTMNYNYATRKGGACYKCGTIADCASIVGNAASSAGSVLADTSATNCVFARNYGCIHWRETSGYFARLEDCDISDNSIGVADLYRCRVHNVSNKVVVAGNVHYPAVRTNDQPYVFYSCRNLRNTLVTGCALLSWAGNYALFYKDIAVTTQVENCTFADNRYPYLARGYNTNSSSQMVAVNTVIVRNFNPSGVHFDVAGYESPRMAFTNCVVARVDWKPGEGFGLVNTTVLGENQYARVKFQDEGDTPYAPRLASPCRNKGLVLDWMTDDAIDLAGKQRLRDGKVDAGCYECWLKYKGFMMGVY